MTGKRTRVKNMPRRQQRAAMANIRAQHDIRSPRARAMDARRTANRTLDPATDNLHPWQRPPNRCDVHGVDDKRCRKELERIEEIKRNADLIIKSAVIIAAYNTPVVREVYLCYSIAKLVYSSWDEIYAVYQKPDKKETIQDVCKVGKSGIKIGLTNYQTDIVWKKIEKEIPEDIKYESESVLKGGMSNISEKEISIVENALRYI